MSISLEWVVLPDGVYLRTICKNGVPLPDPTRYLLSYAYPDHASTQTIRTYAQYLLPFYKWLDRRGLTLEDITPIDLQRYRRELTLIDTSAPPLLRKGAESASSTVRYAVSTAVRYILWAMEVDDTEPFIRIVRGRVPSRRRISFSQLAREDVHSLTDRIVPADKRHELPKHLTQEQLDRCREWIKDAYSFDPQLQLRNRAIFELLWDGALRKGSLLGLQSKSVNWLECSILVSFDEKDYREAWYRKKSNYRTAKTGEYTIIVSDQTIQWLDRYRQEAWPVEAVRLKHGIFFCEHAPHASRSDHGRPLSDETLRYLFDSMSKPQVQGGAGIHVTPHMLRHTWATMALNDGLPEEVVQEQLGHASIVTTGEYGHVAPAKRRQILNEWRESHPERYGGNIR
jgi:site-specific recombinase XerD